MLQIIMMLCMYPVLVILFFVLRYEGKFRNGVLFGAKLSQDAADSPEVLALCRRYRRELLALTIFLAAVPLCFWLIPYDSVSLTLWVVWLFAAIILYMLPYARANRRVREWKAEHLAESGSGTPRLLPEPLASAERAVHFFPFALPAALSVALAVWAAVRFHSRDLWVVPVVTASFAAVSLLLWLFAVWMDARPDQLLCSDGEANLSYHRACKRLWKNFWLGFLWCNTIFTAGETLAMIDLIYRDSAVPLLWGCGLYTAALLAVIILLMRRRSVLDREYADQMDLAPVTGDDDSVWLWGMFYCNPNDRSVMVERRFGVGMTMNMATAAGKAMLVICAAAVAVCLAFCGWAIRLEFTPIHLTVSGDTLTAVQIRNDYQIPEKEIGDLSLVYELPNWSRVNGTGMENLLKGTFRIRGGERCEVFLNPNNGVFLRFEADGTEYYMSGADDGETMAVYRALTQ